MYLLITPDGGRYWRMDYRFAGKRRTLALGVYPAVTLAGARERREEARRLLANATDPSIAKKIAQRASRIASENTFEAIAREWISRQRKRLAQKYCALLLARLEADIFPYIGSRPIAEIDAPELLEVLRRVEKRGVVETALRLRQTCGQVFRDDNFKDKFERVHQGDFRIAKILWVIVIHISSKGNGAVSPAPSGIGAEWISSE